MRLLGYAKKRKNKQIMNKIIFIIGFALSCYPVISNRFVQKQQIEVLSSYQDIVKKEEQHVLNEQLKKAQNYNRVLCNNQTNLELGLGDYQIEDYTKQLKIKDSSIMACIEIPKIKLKLPVYHSTTQEVLSQGIGHFEGTSLPVGGENTHCVLMGHRGLPRAKLFVRLDELAQGDLIFLESCGKKLVYQVKTIEVIDPKRVETLKIKLGKDLVSLVTCTPYGINTNRLVVTGERVIKQERTQNVKTKLPSIRERVFDFLPFVFCIIAFFLIFKEGRRKKHEHKKK